MPVDGRKQNQAKDEEVLTKSNSQERILKKRGYTLGKILGEGSYAKVYLAEYQDPKTNKRHRLACKLINGTAAPKDFLRKFFPREVEIMSKVNHQYIIRVHSILQRKHKYFIFMQYGENGDLLEFIRSNGPVRERQGRIWFAQLLKGLKYLHDRDIAHRDMKCENLLLTASYNIKISDFGFARYTTDDNGKQVMSDTFCGSVSYASPEIIRGQLYDCKLADLWSIGIVLYIILNKAMPFDDSSLKKLYDAQMNRSWKVRSKLKDVLTNLVKNFLSILLEPDPLKRKSLEEIWLDPWIQRASNIELLAAGGSSLPKPPPPVGVRLTVPPAVFANSTDASPGPAARKESSTLVDDSKSQHTGVASAVPQPEIMSMPIELSNEDLNRLKSAAEIPTIPVESSFFQATLEIKPGVSQLNVLKVESDGEDKNVKSRKSSAYNDNNATHTTRSRTSRSSRTE